MEIKIMNILSKSSNRRKKIYLILSLIGLILFFYEIWKIKPVVVEAEDLLGLTFHLTIEYWIGLLLMTLCSIFVYQDNELKNDWVFIFVLLITGTFLFGLVLAEENTHISVSYYPSGEVKKIMSDGRIDTKSLHPLGSYRSWPAFHMISTYILYLTNVDLISVTRYMPIFWMLIYIFVTFSIGKGLSFSSNQCFLLSFLAISSFWATQNYYSPQSFAMLLSISMFYVIFTLKNGIIKKCLSVLLFSALVITHILTTVGMLLSLLTYSKYKKYKNNISIKKWTLFFIIFMAWYMYLSPTIIKWGIPDFISQIKNFESLSIASNKFHPSTLTESLSKISQSIYILIYLIPIGIFIFNKNNYKQKIELEAILYWLSGLIFIIIIVYGTEIFERLYIYSLIPMACFMIISFRDNKKSDKIFMSIMIIFIILNVPAHYGSEALGMTFTTELKGSEFFATKIHPTDPDFFFYQYSPYIYYYDPDIILVKNNMFYRYYNYSLVDKMKYIINSKQSNTILLFRFGFDPLKEWLIINQKEINLLYDNQNFKIYKKKGIDRK